jgi:hypothetical protein
MDAPHNAVGYILCVALEPSVEGQVRAEEGREDDANSDDQGMPATAAHGRRVHRQNVGVKRMTILPPVLQGFGGSVLNRKRGAFYEGAGPSLGRKSPGKVAG